MISIDLSQKTALVTGSTGELGRTMIRTFVAAGANVAIHYLNSSDTAKMLEKEAKDAGVDAVTVQGDITKQEDVRRMRGEVVDAIGDPDIIVDNAVIQYQWTKVLEQSPEDYESQFRSCVLQNVHMAQAFIPAMQKKKWGRFIALNTECAMQTWENQSAYASGKRGMDGVIRVLAKEVGGDGITVNQVAPGFTITDNHPDTPDIQWYIDKVPLKRRGTAQEIANVVVFLASDLASFITGAYIPVSGGNVMPAI
jgi:3-oxoacyl-[acyl-carrier protein] reductase